MIRTRYLIFCLVLSIISCRRTGTDNNIPICIAKEITDNQHRPDWWIGSVAEYSFQNRTVYAFQPDGRIIADASTKVKDADCNTLCTIGGFGGPQVNMCNGDNFFQQAIFVRTIWEKK